MATVKASPKPIQRKPTTKKIKGKSKTKAAGFLGSSGNFGKWVAKKMTKSRNWGNSVKGWFSKGKKTPLPTEREIINLRQNSFEYSLKLITTKTNRERGPVATVVYDKITGKTYYGINSPTAIEDLHPILRKRLDALNLRTNNKGNRPHYENEIPGSHSEISALNQALKAREKATGKAINESQLDEFLLHNRALQAGRKSVGVPPRCDDCAEITAGVQVIE
jgi:hypothetical protein